MAFVTKQDALQKAVRIEKTITSEHFGGDFLIQELLLSEKIDCQKKAKSGIDTVDSAKWNAGIFSYSVIDPDSPPDARKPLFTYEEAYSIANVDRGYDAVLDVADQALKLSEVSPESLKSGD